MLNDPELHAVKSQVHVDDLRVQSILSNRGMTINVDHEIDLDEAMILALGYKQEFKREFSLWSLFAVSFSVLGLLPSIAACLDYQQLVIGASPIPWILAILFITSVALSMAEIASAFPTSSGTPYAVSQLAPPSVATVMTWFTCWSNWLCQVTAAPSVNYSGACLMFALGTYNNPQFQPTTGQIYALTLAIQIVHSLMTCLPTLWVARINSVGTAANLAFLLIVFVMILAANDRQAIFAHTPDFSTLSKFNSNSTAWGLDNQTEWPTGVAMLMSFLGVIWAMSGYDSPFHLSEECSNAAEAVPRAIVMTAVGGGVIGFMFMLAMAYTIVSLELITQDPQGLGQPFVTYLAQIFKKPLVNAATAMTVIASFFMGESCMVSASRVTYAYSRDGLFPLFSRWGKVVNATTQTPVNAVWINWFIGQLLLLLMFANDVAIGAIFSVGGIAGFVSFVTPTLFKITYSYNTFKRGPFHLGYMSRPLGIVTCSFVLVMIPILCFPYVRGADLTLDQMSWTVVVYFGPMVLALLWYFAYAHKYYIGPKSNLDDDTVVYEDGPEMYSNGNMAYTKDTTKEYVQEESNLSSE